MGLHTALHHAAIERGGDAATFDLYLINLSLGIRLGLLGFGQRHFKTTHRIQRGQLFLVGQFFAGSAAGCLSSIELGLIGTAVKAQITMSTSDAGVVIPQSAIQSMDGKDVVFVREGDTYTARAVTLGARDAGKVEVLSGLTVGEDVVVEQSYVVKADIGKAGASHEH
mgnify:CR=1 FL=1